VLIVNRVRGDSLPGPLTAAIEQYHLKLAGLIPADEGVAELDSMGEPIIRLPDDAPSRQALAAILASLDGSF
jgi:CO dehydrogenase nickel-insertion accessory protein CooC1